MPCLNYAVHGLHAPWSFELLIYTYPALCSQVIALFLLYHLLIQLIHLKGFTCQRFCLATHTKKASILIVYLSYHLLVALQRLL